MTKFGSLKNTAKIVTQKMIAAITPALSGTQNATRPLMSSGIEAPTAPKYSSRCDTTMMAGAAPICPEGDRYCGVRVWKLTVPEFQRLL